jgi:hypothetical protein
VWHLKNGLLSLPEESGLALKKRTPCPREVWRVTLKKLLTLSTRKVELGLDETTSISKRI